MPLEVVIYQISHPRSFRIVGPLRDGVRRYGDIARIERAENFDPRQLGDVCIIYGYTGHTQPIFKAYMDAGKPALFLDLGYWGRWEGGRFEGYHKVCVNSRHPTAYIEFLMKAKLPDRGALATPAIQPWRETGEHILLCGMSDKAAASVGYRPNEWETAVVQKLRKKTKRQIVYRSKPGLRNIVRQIPGTTLDKNTVIADSLVNCHAVIARHSNAALDAICAGVPVFVEDGAAKPMSGRWLEVEDPKFPENREKWLNAVAWCQFTKNEIESGFMWKSIKGMALV